MGIEGYFVLFVIAVAMIFLVKGIASSAVILAGALFFCLTFGIITPREALSGLSNQGMVTIALLFIVVAGIQHSGALRLLSYYFLSKRRRRSLNASLFIMMLPVSFLSAWGRH